MKPCFQWALCLIKKRLSSDMWPSEHKVFPPPPLMMVGLIMIAGSQLQGYYLSWKLMSLQITSSSTHMLVCMCVCVWVNESVCKGGWDDRLTLPPCYRPPRRCLPVVDTTLIKLSHGIVSQIRMREIERGGGFPILSCGGTSVPESSSPQQIKTLTIFFSNVGHRWCVCLWSPSGKMLKSFRCLCVTQWKRIFVEGSKCKPYKLPKIIWVSKWTVL